MHIFHGKIFILDSNHSSLPKLFFTENESHVILVTLTSLHACISFYMKYLHASIQFLQHTTNHT
ncbi:hypothetical protein Lalb_Chr05g0213631 [Lupinus albus]|uniref:Uncharacterized protein n=1 Tax=Lupinus albus TaxID=3870 RepID=A0A6A4QI17_LUPAL|nr:hypothetical protein Lalb_Chr05g0213631 [Lupinus albus]